MRHILALIPARGGSKTVPRKNLRLVGGKPLAVHSIEHALASRSITRTILTTDDDEIAEIGRRAGAEVPFRRPAAISGDLSPDFEFVRHALEWLMERDGYEPELVVQLRPTTPIRDPAMINLAVDKLLARPDADSLRAVTQASFTPYKMWRIKGGFLDPVIEPGEHYNLPRQSLPDCYQQDGYIDITRPRTIRSGSLTGSRILPFFVGRPSIDIDYESEITEINERMRSQEADDFSVHAWG